mmetsp:Transcript_49613/g.124745  ORF Transcript_49613/g.124745 Transcript_49613/m.124745 type:complete len:390 (+) Transcript_49613:192-1361(+)
MGAGADQPIDEFELQPMVPPEPDEEDRISDVDEDHRPTRGGELDDVEEESGQLVNVVYYDVDLIDPNPRSIRERIWRFMDQPFSSKPAMILSMFIMACILFSVVTFVLETWPPWYSDPADTLWFVFESVVVGIFTVEFLIRLATTPSYLGFLKNIMNWIDFLAIFPYYIELMVDGGTGPFSAVRVVRLTRVFRIFKLGRYSADFKPVMASLQKSAQALGLLFFFLAIGMILSSSLMFYAEQTESNWDASQQKWFYTDGSENPFNGIPITLWWSIVTITTVGYGDFFPITPAGKVVASLTMLIGILIIALPITIVGATFAESFSEVQLDLANDTFVKRHKKKAAEERLRLLRNRCERLHTSIEQMEQMVTEARRAYDRMAAALQAAQVIE